jgi:hypothetical protein
MPVRRSAKPKKIVPLSQRKLKMQFIAPALAMIITLAGVGVATQLSQRSQDVRSDASMGNSGGGCNIQQVGHLFVRTSSNNGKNWDSWKGPNEAVTAGTGLITGFSAWTDALSVNKQYAVRGGQLWIRTLDRAGNWSGWTQIPANIVNKGSGALTSFSSHFFNHPLPAVNGKVRQYAVKGGELWVRTSTSEAGREPTTWTEWAGPNKVMDGIGRGTLTGFSSYEGFGGGKYENKQYAVKGGELWVRTSADNVSWTAWQGPNRAADPAGSGTLKSFAAIVEPTGIKQYAVKESTIEVCSR